MLAEGTNTVGTEPGVKICSCFPLYCSFFQSNMAPDLWKNLETFGVLCHGPTFSESLMFQYDQTQHSQDR